MFARPAVISESGSSGTPLSYVVREAVGFSECDEIMVAESHAVVAGAAARAL